MTQEPPSQQRAGQRGGLAVALAVATATGVLGLGAEAATAKAGEPSVVAFAATNKNKGGSTPCHKAIRVRHGRRAASVKAGQRYGYLR